MEITQEDLVIMVGVEQGPEVAGKLVKPGEPDPLFITSIIIPFTIQLWMKTDKHLPVALDSFKLKNGVGGGGIHSPLLGRADS